MKYIKRIFLGIFILFLLAGAFIFILVRFYKKEMASMLVENLKTNYGLNLKIEDADVSLFTNWPQASVELKNIYLASDLYADKNEPLLRARSMSLSLDLSRLLKKQFIINSISLKDAEILLVKDIDGSSNFKFKSRPDSAAPAATPSTISFEVSKISIRNTKFNFVNRGKQQNIALRFLNTNIRMKQAQDGMRASLKGRLLVGELLFNPNKGAFLKNIPAEAEVEASVYYKSKMIVIHPSSSVTMEKHRYAVSSFIQLGDAKKLMLRIAGKDINYESTGRLLPAKIQHVLSNFVVGRSFNADALIIAKLGIKEDPILIVNLDVNDNDIKIGNSKIPYSHVSLKGSIVSLDSSRDKGNIEEAKIIFKNIKGNIYDYPFTATIKIVNLTDPFITANARVFVEATKIKFKVAQDFILKGSCVLNVAYTGPTKKLNKDEFLSPAMRLTATMLCKNLSYQEKGEPFTYVVNGKASMNNRDLKFDRLMLSTDAGNAELSGKAENFVNYVLGYSNKVKATLNATSDYLDLNAFLADKANAAAAEKKPDEAKKTSAAKTDESNFEFNASLLVKKLLVRKVVADNANISLFYNNRLLNIKSIKANTCGGKIAAKANIYNLSKIDAELSMQDININTLFDEFENFGQSKVESRHLKGTISMNANFKTDLDEKMHVIAPSMAGDVKLKLKDGHLVNFEPVQSMSNFIFKNRDFNDVTFSELNETFKIKGYEMNIEELEIASNILNMFVSGIYNFKESSNINILIPWSNLRKRGKNYIPKSSGESAENSKGLKLNFSGPTSNMKLSMGHKDLVKQ